MSCKPNIYCCVPGCTQKGTVDLEGNRVGFLVSQSKEPKSSTRIASEDVARCWPRISNSQRPQRYALSIFTQVMRREELEAESGFM